MEQLLAEILRRQFQPTQIRVLLQVLALTVGRGRADVRLSGIAELARLCDSARPHVSGVVDELVSLTVLGRDEKAGTWWLQPVDLWLQQPDPALDAATAAAIEADERRSQQRQMWSQPAPSEILTPRPSTVRNSDGALSVCARAPEPGTETRNQGARGKGTGLDAAGWSLLTELIEWCSAQGEACADRHRVNWGWRVWTQPTLIEWALLQARRHVADGKPCRSRFGLVKSFWRRRAADDNFRATPPRSAARLHGGASALPAGGLQTSAPAGGAAAPLPALVLVDADAAGRRRADEAGLCEPRACPAGGAAADGGMGWRAAVLAQIVADREEVQHG